MPILTHIDPDARVVMLTVTGPDNPPHEEWAAAFDGLRDDPRFGPGFGFLEDVRAAAAPDTAYIDACVRLAVSRAPTLLPGRWAVVVGSAAAFGMYRMAATKAEWGGVDARPFYDPDAARRWLGAGD